MIISKQIKLFIALMVLMVSSSCFAMEFPLPESNFVRAKMPLNLIYPRPDTETQVIARHRWAHTGMEYRIPIGVQGGAWPFKYEIIDGPSSALVGSFYGDSNYGVISWQPSASGAFSFKVRVTDQELSTIDVSWNVTVDDSQFVFIQDGYSGAQKGTISEPLEDISDWYKGNMDDATYKDKIIVFRGGNYLLQGGTDSNNNVRLRATSKTPSLIGFPGEVATIDASQSKIFSDNNSLKDIFIAGLRWENSRQDVTNAHFFWAVGDVTRSTWWENYFFNHGPGTVGTDNTSAVFVSSKKSLKNYILYKGNTHDEFHNTGTNGSYVDIYYTSNVLIEENIAKNSENSYGFWAKGTTAFVSIRANQAWDNVTGRGISIGYGTESPELAHDHEVCWNRLANPAGSSGNGIITWAVSGQYAGSTFNSYIYRNTFLNSTSRIRFKGVENYETDGNVVISNKMSDWNTEIMTTTIPNLVGGESSGITDSTGKLKGESRNTYLGLAGFEVSGSNATTTPKNPTGVVVQ